MEDIDQIKKLNKENSILGDSLEYDTKTQYDEEEEHFEQMKPFCLNVENFISNEYQSKNDN